MGPRGLAKCLCSFLSTSIDPTTGAMFVRNPWNAGFGSRIAFADLGGQQTDWTGDRREFIGRNGTLARPAALLDVAPLSKTVGAGLDPCGALRTAVELRPDDVVEITFFLGQAASDDVARTLIARYRAADLDEVRSEVAAHWDDVLGAVQVRTPDRAMDILLNGWFLYQTLACRIWARSGFYQASGAYGFRDQLAGRHGAHTLPSRANARASSAGCRPTVRRGRRPALVAPAFGPGRPYANLRRSSVARLCGRALCQRDRRRAPFSTRRCPFFDGRRLDIGEHDSFFQPDRLG